MLTALVTVVLALEQLIPGDVVRIGPLSVPRSSLFGVERVTMQPIEISYASPRGAHVPEFVNTESR